MTYTVYLPTDEAATSLAFHATFDDIDDAIAAANVPGAIVEAPAQPVGTTVIHAVPLDAAAEEAKAAKAAAALLPPGYVIAPPEPAPVVLEAGAAALEQGLGLPPEQGAALSQQLYSMLVNGEGVIKP